MMTDTKTKSAEAFTEAVGLPTHADSSGEALPQRSLTRPPILAIRLEPSTWLDQCLRRLQQLGELPENWDSYGAERVDPISIAVGQQLLVQLARVQGVEAPIVTASPDGNVCFGWDNGNKSVDVEVFSEGEFAYTYLNERVPQHGCEGRTHNSLDIAQLLTAW